MRRRRYISCFLVLLLLGLCAVWEGEFSLQEETHLAEMAQWTSSVDIHQEKVEKDALGYTAALMQGRQLVRISSCIRAAFVAGLAAALWISFRRGTQKRRAADIKQSYIRRIVQMMIRRAPPFSKLCRI